MDRSGLFDARRDHRVAPTPVLAVLVVAQDVAHPTTVDHVDRVVVDVSAVTRGGRLSGVHQWPDLGVGRGYASQVRSARPHEIVAFLLLLEEHSVQPSKIQPDRDGPLLQCKSQSFLLSRYQPLQTNVGQDSRQSTVG
jgi:hypothetical protein